MADYYIKRLYDFLDRLAVNNNREWFALHKSEYQELRELWLADLDKLIGYVCQWSPDLVGQTARSSAYRIYRDTRFSPDKTPYKTFFSAAVSDRGKSTVRAGYYIEIGCPRYLDQGLYGGIWCLGSDELRKMRHAIVDNIEEWEEILADPALQKAFPQWCSETLKTIPKGWPRNHPQAEYLRMTNYGRWASEPRAFFLDPAWPERTSEMFASLHRFIQFLNYSLDE